MPADGGLALPLGQIKAFGAHAGWNVGKKLIQTAHANHGEHFMQLFRRMRNVWHISSLPPDALYRLSDGSRCERDSGWSPSLYDAAPAGAKKKFQTVFAVQNVAAAQSARKKSYMGDAEFRKFLFPAKDGAFGRREVYTNIHERRTKQARHRQGTKRPEVRAALSNVFRWRNAPRKPPHPSGRQACGSV